MTSYGEALNVSPNRMELSAQETACRSQGHKLLKDKQDALVKAFLEKARAVWDLRQEIEKEISSCYSASFSQEPRHCLKCSSRLSNAGGDMRVNVRFVNLMSVRALRSNCLNRKWTSYGLGHPRSLTSRWNNSLSLCPGSSGLPRRRRP